MSALYLAGYYGASRHRSVRRISSAIARSQHPALMFLVRKYPGALERLEQVATA